MRQGFWKENSIALSNREDDLMFIQCGCDGVPDKEKIRLRITSCDAKDPKIHYTAELGLQDAERMLAMLQDIVAHGHEMNRIEEEKKREEERKKQPKQEGPQRPNKYE